MEKFLIKINLKFPKFAVNERRNTRHQKFYSGTE
jgi:hypothetical protein